MLFALFDVDHFVKLFIVMNCYSLFSFFADYSITTGVTLATKSLPLLLT